MATKSYTVIGPLVLAKNEQGGDVYLSGTVRPGGRWRRSSGEEQAVAPRV
jgi:hypothetical protein